MEFDITVPACVVTDLISKTDGATWLPEIEPIIYLMKRDETSGIFEHDYNTHRFSTIQNPFEQTISYCFEYTLHAKDGTLLTYAKVTPNGVNDEHLEIEINVDDTNIEEFLDLISTGAQEFYIQAKSAHHEITSSLNDPIKIAFRCHSD